MCGIGDDSRSEIYPEVEIYDDLGVGLGVGLVGTTLVVPAKRVGGDEAGSGFFVGSAYVEVVCWRGGGVGEEEAVESFTWGCAAVG